MPVDARTQLRLSQAVQRFFRKLQAQTGITQSESIMLMLAATWGQAKLGGMTTPQLLDWAMKNWQSCDEAQRKALGGLIVDGQGADVTTAEQESARKRIISG